VWIRAQQVDTWPRPECAGSGNADQHFGHLGSPDESSRFNHFLDLSRLADAALFVPETMSLMTLLEQFKRTHLPLALVVDEFGDAEGLVSLTDVIAAMVGELPSEPGEEPSIVQREDGSWLMDGGLDLETVLRTLDTDSLLSDEDLRHYHTLGGLAMLALGRVPKTGDVFERREHRFEIVDMDGNRVDRVLISRIRSQSTSSSDRRA
jgi:putative hemolysin